MMEFHISRKARERYQFAESLFSYSGNVIFANVAACREFAYRMNTVRDVERHPELAVHAGHLYAMGLIDEASHVLMARYREQFDPAVFTQALEWFSGAVGAKPLGQMLLTFVEEFPGLEVIRGKLTARQWLSGETDGVSHWAVALEELLLLWTANRNEAFKPFEELFEEKSLAERTVYQQVTRQFPEYFATRPLIPVEGAKGVSLLELLRAPAVGAPGSLSEQLKLIRTLWKPLLGTSLDHYLEIAAEILHEEELAIWLQFNPPAQQAKAVAEAAARRRRESGTQLWPAMVSTADVPVFGDPAQEYEKFSPDMAWMPTAVMIAKSTYVWLAQLSRQYGRAIRRLDEIPDEALATLAAHGLNTLWLIGVWERSRASKTIKQLCGNTDAVASAYSLFDYTIADDLGGEAAYIHLRDRAYHYGIRLASDMVPNHMGIDSPWVVEHPDWFISRPESPYPVYSFNGPDLSQDGRVEIKIEDHYYDETDAAVVFRRRDQQSGETRYIYHGNDGTSFPWNDTAQLDYLNPAVREQVIQTILHVARLFPVIRFDAAMTLAKRHFHRLWFPGPGTSGAIPSRAEYGMSQAEFNQAMPKEFWREVVDRVAAEVPGTLLLAEAFWLMEGYFVRTLGMHRVYNSAFMVMLRDEDNAKYRSVIKNTIEFDPDILKRYVNFMSNPDERTAIDQFGKGDKCFGVAAMMATLPGLPMFGHGQIEGFTEKYGMEYQRPRYDENADHWMVERHEREIAPLLKRRRLFAESDNFLLYDFYLNSGKVDENVFAYSNRRGSERALVIFNNRYAETRGTIDWSAAYADKSTSQLRQQKIGEGLGFGDAGKVLAWRDSLTGLEYLRRASDLTERGLMLELHAYQCHVFLDWREMTVTAERPWDRLCDQLKGRGVASLEDALVKLELQPTHDALRLLLEPGLVRSFAGLAEHPRTLAVGANPGIEAERTQYFEAAWTRCESFLHEAQRAYTTLAGAALPAHPGLLRAAYRARLRAAMRIPAVEALFPAPWTVAARRMLPSPSPQWSATEMWGPVLGWCALELLAESISPEKPELVALDLFDRLRLREPFALAFGALGFEGEEGWRVAARIKVVLLAEAGIGKPDEVEAVIDSAAAAMKGSAAAMKGTAAAMRGTGFDPYVNRADNEGALQGVEKLDKSPEASGHDFSRAGNATKNTGALAPEEIPSVRLPVFWPALWLDPDLRWLTGVHSAEGHEYLVRERYEELLWWLLMPSLLRLAGETAPGLLKAQRAAVQAMSLNIDAALAKAEAAAYRVDLLAPAKKNSAESVDLATEPEAEADVKSVAEPEKKPAVESVEAMTAADEKPSIINQEEQAGKKGAEAAEVIRELEPEPIEAVMEEPAEVVPEPESAPEKLPSSSKEPDAVELEVEAAAETVVEPEPEALVASVETVPEAEAAPSPSEKPEQPEPVAAEIEAAVEVVPESEVKPELEPAAENQPSPDEEHDPTEPDPTGPATVPTAQSDSEPEPESASAGEEHEEIAEEASVSAERPEQIEQPKAIEPEVEARFEAVPEVESEAPAVEKAPEADAPFSHFDELAKAAGEKLRLFGRSEDESLPKAEDSFDLKNFLREFSLPSTGSSAYSATASPAEQSGETGNAAVSAVGGEAETLIAREPEEAEPEVETKAAVVPEVEPETTAEAPVEEEAKAAEAEVEPAAESVPDVKAETAQSDDPEAVAEDAPLPVEPQKKVVPEIEAESEPEPAATAESALAPEAEPEAAKVEAEIEVPDEAASQLEPVAEAQPLPMEPQETVQEIEATVGYVGLPEPEAVSASSGAAVVVPIVPSYPSEPDEEEDVIEYVDDDSEEEAEDEAEAEEEDVIEYVDDEQEEEAEETPLSGDEEPGESEVEAEYEDEGAVESVFEEAAEAEDEAEVVSEEPEEEVEEAAEEAEAEEEEPEARPSKARGLVGSIASIFSRKSAAASNPITLGLSDPPKWSGEPVELASAEGSYTIHTTAHEEESALADEEEVAEEVFEDGEEEPAPIEPFEPPAPEITLAVESDSDAPKTLATAPVLPSLIEPFEPSAPVIEFKALSPAEVAAERRRRIGKTSRGGQNDGLGGDTSTSSTPRRRSDD